MAIPLSAIRKYTPEIVALSVVAIVLGAFWSIVDTYQPSYLLGIKPSNVTSEFDTENITDVFGSTVATPLSDNLKRSVPNELNEMRKEIDDEFAIGAPKIIKFVLTGWIKSFSNNWFNILTLMNFVCFSLNCIFSGCNSSHFRIVECRKDCRLLWPCKCVDCCIRITYHSIQCIGIF